MWARCAAGGSVPWWRQTTIGTSQISHSAIQHTSSSWNHCVIRAAVHRSQPSRAGGGTNACPGAGDDLGSGAVTRPAGPRQSPGGRRRARRRRRRTRGSARGTRCRPSCRAGRGCRCGRPRSEPESKLRTSTAPRGEHMSTSSSNDSHDSSLYDSTSSSASTRAHDGPQRVRHATPTIEDALRVRVARVDPLAGHAVVLGRIPRDERLPHVVVGEVAVLVVGRVEVGEVEGPERRGPRRRRRPRTRATGTGEQLGDPQLEWSVRARRPLLHVGHLHAGRGVDPVGRLDEAGEEDRLQRRAGVVACDRVADRVDARAVVGLQEPGLHTEGVGEVPRRRRKGIELRDRRGHVARVDVARRRWPRSTARTPRRSARCRPRSPARRRA